MIDALVVEVVGILLYFVAFYVACRIGKLDFLVYITVFAIVFENLNVWLFASSGAGYFYSGDFLFYIFETPVFVFLDWAILVFGAYLVSLKLKMSEKSRIFFVPVFVVLVDFVIEGVSVALRFWTWSDVVSGANLFSLVPASNFAGWLGVVFGFMICYEFLERKWLSMGLGYFVFLGVAVVYVGISRTLGLVDASYISLVVILGLFVFGFLYFYHKDRGVERRFGKDWFYGRWIVLMRGMFYVYALYYFVVREFYLDVVYDLVLVFVLMVEGYFGLRYFGVLRKQV